MADATPTLHHADTDLEIHKVVVGPMDNNVFVLKCRHTGDAVLIDAKVRIAALAASSFRPRAIPESLQSELKKNLVESP